MRKHLKIKHLCPLCNETHEVLNTYQLVGISSIFFEGDFVTNLNSNKRLSFIAAYGFCGKNRYDVKVGINNNILTEIVIHKENDNHNH